MESDKGSSVAESKSNKETVTTTLRQYLQAPEINFSIIPPTLLAEQRRVYVRYEEDNEGNLL